MGINGAGQRQDLHAEPAGGCWWSGWPPRDVGRLEVLVVTFTNACSRQLPRASAQFLRQGAGCPVSATACARCTAWPRRHRARTAGAGVRRPLISNIIDDRTAADIKHPAR